MRYELEQYAHMFPTDGMFMSSWDDFITEENRRQNKRETALEKGYAKFLSKDRSDLITSWNKKILDLEDRGSLYCRRLGPKFDDWKEKIGFGDRYVEYLEVSRSFNCKWWRREKVRFFMEFYGSKYEVRLFEGTFEDSRVLINLTHSLPYNILKEIAKRKKPRYEHMFADLNGVFLFDLPDEQGIEFYRIWASLPSS